MIKAIKSFLQDDRGMQTGEYMILGTVMGAGSIGAIKAVRDGQHDKFYQLCMETTLKRYESHYTEKVFVEHWNRIWS